MVGAFEVLDCAVKRPMNKVQFSALDSLIVVENLCFCLEKSVREKERRQCIVDFVEWKQSLGEIPEDFKIEFDRDAEKSNRFTQFFEFFEVNQVRLRQWIALLTSGIKSKLDPIVSDFFCLIVWDIAKYITEQALKIKYKGFEVLLNSQDESIFSSAEVVNYCTSPLSIFHMRDACFLLLNSN
jgi:hypothetical protein